MAKTSKAIYSRACPPDQSLPESPFTVVHVTNYPTVDDLKNLPPVIPEIWRQNFSECHQNIRHYIVGARILGLTCSVALTSYEYSITRKILTYQAEEFLIRQQLWLEWAKFTA
jgi:hypothetical protein